LQMSEKKVFEDLFQEKGAGWVLDFSDSRYREFFKGHDIDIENQKYQTYGSSKMKRLRAFWEIEDDKLVGKVLESLLNYADTLKTVKQ
jgi:hypothetical protein